MTLYIHYLHRVRRGLDVCMDGLSCMTVQLGEWQVLRLSMECLVYVGDVFLDASPQSVQLYFRALGYHREWEVVVVVE